MSDKSVFGFPIKFQFIDEADPTPYEHMVTARDGDVVIAAGYRHGRIEIFEALHNTNEQE